MELAPSLPRINKKKVGESVYEILREKIVSKELTPGQRLNLDAFETQLGISRTPLKEALGRLAREGLVEIIPQSGTFVTHLSAEDIAESFDVRRALEVSAVESAVQRASDDDLRQLREIVRQLGELAASEDHDAIYPQFLALDHSFHRQLVALTRNRRLCRAHDGENIHAQMARVRYRRSERELNIAQEEHERIMTALEARDAETTKAELDAHLRRAKRSLLTEMKSNTRERQTGSDVR